VARRCDDEAERAAQRVRFGLLRAKLPALPDVVRAIPQEDLPADRPWGPLLRAPDLFLDVQSQARGLPLVSLGELVTLRRGFTTNDNRFFYPPQDAGIEGDYLRPLLKSPKRVGGVRGWAEALPDRVFVCSRTRAELEALGHGGALAWIERHRAGQPPRSWALAARVPSRLFLVKGYADRFRQPLFDHEVYCDQQLYSVRPTADGVDEVVLAAMLNSSWFHLSLEMAGRVNFGDGVLWLSVADARDQVRVPDLRLLDGGMKARLLQAFLDFPEGRVPACADIASDPHWAPALQALDVVVGDLLGLGTEDALALRDEWVARCGRRLAMAGL